MATIFKKIQMFENITKLTSRQFLQFSVRNYRHRRALMYVPGSDERKINKIASLNADCVALDCEDGVALNKKDEARDIIRKKLEHIIPTANGDIGVRVNSIESGLCEKDLEVCLSGTHLPHTVLLPKVENSDHLKWFSDRINKFIKTDQKVNLIIYIESAKAFINLSDICKTAFTLSECNKFTPTSLVFGSDDFCASIGATRTEDSTEILYARQKLVLCAKAFHLQAIDMVYIKYKDLEGLKRQCEEGMRMGYTGKQVIHPNQIETVQESFLPALATVEWAKGLLDAFEEHQATGKGAFNYRGSMIDMPTMKQAKNIIDIVKPVKKKST
ncbi:unnamed protein product [Psylliodes chrysocephalus]|uniref:Citramalyl-CoA lyase, mitochondrial n=1 Tax=Psylliodes chrysocephalus TaxID=3402493 RepID=A0A9P0D300_9CUCU|nr:unnamed protein product [Psylliodes chrysocephala]